MIDFYTLAAAAHYIPTCLLCKNGMSFRDIDAEVSYNYDFTSGDHYKTSLTFTDSNLAYTDKITICMETEGVSRQTTQNDYKAFSVGYTGVSSSLYSSAKVFSGSSLCSSAPERGDKYLGLGLECRKCHDYTYMIRIVVDLANLRMKRITLNSESVSIRSDEGLFLIRNAYTIEKTEYMFSQHPAPAGSSHTFTIDKQQVLPLIPLDRDDPKKTLKRIRNLLIFT